MARVVKGVEADEVCGRGGGIVAVLARGQVQGARCRTGRVVCPGEVVAVRARLQPQLPQRLLLNAAHPPA